MNTIPIRVATIAFLTLLAPQAVSADTYEDEILEWRERRLETLKGPRGYLNLIGLLELTEGAQTFGYATSDDLRLAGAAGAGTIGVFRKRGDRVMFTADSDATVVCDGKPVAEMEVFLPDQETPVVLEFGALRWFVIQRGPQLFVRARDLESAYARDFPGFDFYTIKPAWRFEAEFVRLKAPTTFTVADVLGQNVEMKSTGKLKFTHVGETYLIDAVDEGEKLFVIFGDATNGSETYGAGRFVYVTKPTEGNTTILDFNKSYNPPCALSDFTTCPLPPKGNILPMAIRAGEREYGDGH